MYKSRVPVSRYLWIVITMFLVGASTQASARLLEVLALDPTPNYRLTTDGMDIEQLVDGELAAHPSWSKKDSVGWSRAQVVTLHLRLKKSDGARDRYSGALRIHTTFRSGSDIYPPKRIDVYSRESHDRWIHVEGAQWDRKDLKDDSDHWVSISIDNASSDLLLVVHVDGEYFFCDEIEWRASPVSSPVVHQAALADTTAARTDSLVRLKRGMESRQSVSAERVAEWRASFIGQGIVVWPTDPWGKLEAAPAATTIIQARNRTNNLSMTGIGAERESACIGVLNPRDRDVTVQISIVGSAKPIASLQLSSVEPITAANGMRVYDALRPLDQTGAVNVASQSVRYIWIDAEFAALAVGQVDLVLKFNDGRDSVSVPVVLEARRLRQRPSAVSAVNWAYETDKPIWSAPTEAVGDLRKHGINVFVVPAQKIPRPRLDHEPLESEFKALANALTLIGRDGFLLLYLNWDVVLEVSRPRMAAAGFQRGDV